MLLEQQPGNSIKLKMCDMLCNSKTRCKKNLGNLLKKLNNNYGPSEHKSYNKEPPAAESLRVRKGEGREKKPRKMQVM